VLTDESSSVEKTVQREKRKILSAEGPNSKKKKGKNTNKLQVLHSEYYTFGGNVL
jgi:hypothetical protein